jgi:hypothetical protein
VEFLSDDSVGRQLQRLGVTGSARSDAGAALVNYVLGSAAQYAAGARRVPHDAARQDYLQTLATTWTQSDPDSLVHEAASQLHEHNDREQFLAGVDISWPASPPADRHLLFGCRPPKLLRHDHAP